MSESWSGGSDTRWRRFRTALFARWDEQGRTQCEVKLAGCTKAREQVDHIQALARGGAKYDPLNCRPACAWCNRSRGDRGPAPQPQPRPVSTW